MTFGIHTLSMQILIADKDICTCRRLRALRHPKLCVT